MSQTMPFFPRQSVVGTGVEYTSEPFDVSRFQTLNVELRVVGLIGTDPVVVARLETAAELSSLVWSTAKTFTTITAGSVTEVEVLGPGDMSQYVRGHLSMSGGANVALTFSMIGVAREGT